MLLMFLELRQHKTKAQPLSGKRGAHHAINAPGGTLLVADECHRYASSENQRALLDSYEQRLGLTATLERPDQAEQALLEYFGPVCYRIGYAGALADAVVAQSALTLIGVSMNDDEAAVYKALSRQISDHFKTLTRDFGFLDKPLHLFMRHVKEAANEGGWSPARGPALGFLSVVSERKQLMVNSRSKFATAVELAPVMRSADRTLIFTESKQMAEDIAFALRNAHLSAEAIHSDLRDADRQSVFRQFRAGNLEVIVGPRVLDEGVDVPAADLAVIVSASKTRRQMIQRMGRVLRRKEDGRLARIAVLYLAGTTEDPASGAHEAFLDEVTAVAKDLDDFGVDRLKDALTFLCVVEPLQASAEPRMEGGPPPEIVSEVEPDPGVSAEEYYGVD